MITKYGFNKKIALIMFIFGITLLTYPLFQDKLNAEKHETFINEQMQIIRNDIEKEEIKYPSQITISPSITETPTQKPEKNPIKEENNQVEFLPEKPLNKYDRLYNDLKKYNEELYKIGQQNLLDPFMFEVPTIKLSDYEIPTDIFGYISIPAIDIELPIYLGASKENMKLGATYLATTSYPIGGNNSNTVICAHRGYRTQAMFRNIEALKVGDRITITNFWETLTYEITSCAVIYPDEVKNVFIQEGKDMLTLSTCHPYRHNYQRYIVYCERIYPETISEATNNN